MKIKIVLGLGAVFLVVVLFWLWTPDRARAPLEARYARSPADFVTVAGVRLHLRDTGPKTAPAVVLLHGFGGSLHSWEPWALTLSADYRVIRFDLPGAGLTGADPSGDYTDQRGMQVLLALLDQLGVQRTSIIGHSMGGRLAWRFAAQYPQRVDKLILIAPDGFASPGFEYGKPPKVPAAVKMMRYVLPRFLLRLSLAPAYADPAVMTDALVRRYHDLLLAPKVRTALIARMEQTILPDPVPILARIQTPTLLLWGEKDAMIPVASATDYLRALPNARLVTLPGVGHLPQEEAPTTSLPVVAAFLRR